jgi:integral membrane protein
VKSALTRYRVMAYLTGVFLLLLTLHVIVQLVQVMNTEQSWSQVGGLGDWIPGADVWIPVTHGYLYLIYVLVTADLWFRTRIPLLQTALVVIAGTVPFMSFVAERWVRAAVTPLIAAEAAEHQAESVPRAQ